VLCDAGIAQRHCAISIDEFGTTCRALASGITIDGTALPVGAAATLADHQVLGCGPVALGVGEPDADWAAIERSLGQRERRAQSPRALGRLNPWALFATTIVGVTCALGIAYAALSQREVTITASRIEAARQWLARNAPAGSELAIGAQNGAANGLLLSGYVASNADARAVSTSALTSGFAPRIEIYESAAMVDGMARLAALANIPCEPAYISAGRIACTREIADETTAGHLRASARDIPGLTTLELRIAPPPPPPPAPAPAPGPLQITQKFSVLISGKGRYLVGPYGQRYGEGEQYEGFVIRRIGLDEVIFGRDGQEYAFPVAAMGTRS
jgi:hypothetical protein